MIIKNDKKFVPLEKLEKGAVFQKDGCVYIKTTLTSSILDIAYKDAVICVNLENGDWTYFFENDLVYFCNAELIL